jgi:hypothetical protein
MPATPTTNDDVILEVTIEILDDHLLAAVLGLLDRAARVALALMRLLERRQRVRRAVVVVLVVLARRAFAGAQPAGLAEEGFDAAGVDGDDADELWEVGD